MRFKHARTGDAQATHTHTHTHTHTTHTHTLTHTHCVALIVSYFCTVDVDTFTDRPAWLFCTVAMSFLDIRLF